MESNQLQVIALQANQLQKEFSEGNITEDEYKELLSNIGALEAIQSQVCDLEQNLIYRQMILNAINVGKLLI
jgi:hypothetical protein